jgi:hypothetical protein
MYDLNTLGDAQDWCRVQDVDGLIRELNAAIAAEQRPSTEARPEGGRDSVDGRQ